MNNEDEINFEVAISVSKDGILTITPKESFGSALVLKEIPKGSKELQNSATTSASSGVYWCINNVWHWCVFIGGQWYCWPTAYAC